MWFVFIIISVSFWAMSNVLDSVLVKNIEKHPIVLMWSQSFISLIILLLIASFFDLHSSWMGWLLLGGVIAFFGDLIFFVLIDRVDVSVINIAWAILTVFISVAGFYLFGDVWTPPQTIGVFLVLSGIVYLSLAHHHVTFSVVLLLTSLALLYLPIVIIQKASLINGEKVLPVFFWTLFGRESLAFIMPWFFTTYRRRIQSLPQRVGGLYVGISVVVIGCFFGGVYFNIRAYEVGMASLVAVTGNVQPFLVLSLAWMLYRLVPRYAPRELFTAQTMRVKLASFSVVFVGLALLAMGETSILY